MTHICVGKVTIIGSDNGLAPGRRQAIIWTNAGILLIGPSGTNFGEILIGIKKNSFKKMHLKMSSAKWRPFCPGLSVQSVHSVGQYFLRCDSGTSIFYGYLIQCMCNCIAWHTFTVWYTFPCCRFQGQRPLCFNPQTARNFKLTQRANLGLRGPSPFTYVCL